MLSHQRGRGGLEVSRVGFIHTAAGIALVRALSNLSVDGLSVDGQYLLDASH